MQILDMQIAIQVMTPASVRELDKINSETTADAFSWTKPSESVGGGCRSVDVQIPSILSLGQETSTLWQF